MKNNLDYPDFEGLYMSIEELLDTDIDFGDYSLCIENLIDEIIGMKVKVYQTPKKSGYNYITRDLIKEELLLIRQYICNRIDEVVNELE